MAEASSKTILLVEDFDDIRDALSMLLELQGYAVIEATDGHEAVEKARQYHPDLILMDIAMPAFDGITAVKEIRSFKELSNVRIVALTAHTEYTTEALAAGYDEVVNKTDFIADMPEFLAKYLPMPGDQQ
jgi:CheY-like chemotaxis protein